MPDPCRLAKPLLLALALAGCGGDVSNPSGQTPPETLSIAIDKPLFASAGWKSTWDPGGLRLAVGGGEYAGWKKGIHIISLGESIQEVEFAGRANAKDPAWSPDGRWIAFVETEKDVEGKGSGKEIVWLADAARGDRAFQIGEGGFPFWPLGSDRLYYHDRPLGAILSVAVPGGEPGEVEFKPRREFLLAGYGHYPSGAWGEGLLGYWDKSWVRILSVRDLLDWPISPSIWISSNKSALSSMGGFTRDLNFYVHGSDGNNPVPQAKDPGILAASVRCPGERFLVWHEAGARPSISADGKWLAFDKESLSSDPWTRLVPLEVQVARLRSDLKKKVLDGDEGLDLGETAALLRFSSPGMEPAAAFLDLMGRERSGDPQISSLAELISAWAALDGGDDPVPLEPKVRSILEDLRSGRLPLGKILLGGARRLLAEILAARGDLLASAALLSEAGRETGDRGLWRAALWASAVGGDDVLAREAASSLRKGSGMLDKKAGDLSLEKLALDWQEGKAPPDISRAARSVDLAKAWICAAADGKSALESIDMDEDLQRGIYYRSRALLLTGQHQDAFDALDMSTEARGVILKLILLDILGREAEGRAIALAISDRWWPSEWTAYPLAYLLRHGKVDEVRAFLDGKGYPLLAHTLLGAVARLARSKMAVPENPWPDAPRGVPDVPTAPVRALDLARRGLPVPPSLLAKALGFVRRMELTYSRLEDSLVSPYRRSTRVALTFLAGRKEEAVRRLDLAIRTGEDPFQLWLDPDIILLGNPPELRAVFKKHGIAPLPEGGAAPQGSK